MRRGKHVYNSTTVTKISHLHKHIQNTKTICYGGKIWIDRFSILSSNQPHNQSVSKSVNQHDQVIIQPVSQLVSQQASQPNNYTLTYQPLSQSVSQLTDKTTKQSTSQSANKPDKQPVNQSAITSTYLLDFTLHITTQNFYKHTSRGSQSPSFTTYNTLHQSPSCSLLPSVTL